MKKLLALTLVLGFSSTAALASVPGGEATYHVNTELKSTANRADVLAKSDSSNIANSMDATPAPIYKPSAVTRAEVIRKMEGYRYNEFGDGTSLEPWVKIR